MYRHNDVQRQYKLYIHMDGTRLQYILFPAWTVDQYSKQHG